MTTIYIATRHEAYYTVPDLYIVNISYADEPPLVYVYDKHLEDFHNTRKVEGTRDGPIVIHATTLITLPPFTRSHRITIATKDTLDATTKVSILSASDDSDAIRAALAEDIAAAEDEAREKKWDGMKNWQNDDPHGADRRISYAYVYNSRTRKWIWWELWERTVWNDRATRTDRVDDKADEGEN
jgi:hypothetical protein